MIVSHLGRLLEERGLSVSELSRRSGISRSTLHDLATDRANRYDGKTLDALCRALGVGVGELLEYVPD